MPSSFWLLLQLNCDAAHRLSVGMIGQLLAKRGVPQAIRSDNGAKFAWKATQAWLGRLGIQTLYIAPGDPLQNGYAESFPPKLVDEFLSREEFDSVSAAHWLKAANRGQPRLRPSLSCWRNSSASWHVTLSWDFSSRQSGR